MADKQPSKKRKAHALPASAVTAASAFLTLESMADGARAAATILDALTIEFNKHTERARYAMCDECCKLSRKQDTILVEYWSGREEVRLCKPCVQYCEGCDCFYSKDDRERHEDCNS